MAAIPIAPLGLEYLLQVGEMHVKQTRKSTFQSYCTYDLLGPDDNLVYEAAEHRECWGPRMDLRINNTQGYNVLNLLIPSECCSWETKLQVLSGAGDLLGYVDQNLSSFSSSFNILDPSGLICLKVKGPGWGEGFMSDINYKVLSADKTTQIGVITRVWRGFLKEMSSVKDHYAVSFPMDLEVTMKALLVACTLFIDLLSEERRRNERSRTAHQQHMPHGGIHHGGIHHGGIHHGGIHHGGIHHGGIHHGGIHHGGIHHGGIHHGGIHHGCH